jgi:hypothetical protein
VGNAGVSSYTIFTSSQEGTNNIGLHQANGKLRRLRVLALGKPLFRRGWHWANSSRAWKDARGIQDRLGYVVSLESWPWCLGEAIGTLAAVSRGGNWNLGSGV